MRKPSRASIDRLQTVLESATQPILRTPFEDSGFELPVLAQHDERMLAAQLQCTHAALEHRAAVRGCEPVKRKGGRR